MLLWAPVGACRSTPEYTGVHRSTKEYTGVPRVEGRTEILGSFEINVGAFLRGGERGGGWESEEEEED